MYLKWKVSTERERVDANIMEAVSRQSSCAANSTSAQSFVFLSNTDNSINQSPSRDGYRVHKSCRHHNYNGFLYKSRQTYVWRFASNNKLQAGIYPKRLVCDLPLLLD